MKNLGVWEIAIFQSIHPCVKLVCLAKVNTSITSSSSANWSPQMKQALRPAPPENKAGNVD